MKFNLTFEEVIKLLKENKSILFQGKKYSKGYVFQINPEFEFFEMVHFTKNENKEIIVSGKSAFFMDLNVFKEKYRIISKLEDLF